jgi:uncharacterized protein with von Willebrand factor type A (vWA) domain
MFLTFLADLRQAQAPVTPLHSVEHPNPEPGKIWLERARTVWINRLPKATGHTRSRPE